MPNKGELSEIEFILLCGNKDIEVVRPIFESKPYDFVIKEGTAPWQTVQIKSSYTNSKHERVDIRKKGPSQTKIVYDPNDYDILVVRRNDTKEWYFIPYNDVANKCELRISSPKWQKYKIK